MTPGGAGVNFFRKKFQTLATTGLQRDSHSHPGIDIVITLSVPAPIQ